VAAANAYTHAAYGVELDVSFVDWQRREGGGQDLRDVLGELVDVDAGVDVDWVIGLCAAPARFTTSHHDLGMATLLGKHFVVRDMNDAVEAREIARVFPDMGEADRLRLYAARKAHKELVVFLHEWAHTLGALHERGDGRLMGDAYSHEASTFSESEAGVIERALAIRAIPGDTREAREARAERRYQRETQSPFFFLFNAR
jgi:hypothetical protein